MFRSTFLRLLVLLLLTAPLTGCFYSREIAHTRRDLERAYPEARFDQQVVVSVGPFGLRTLGWIAGWVDDPEARQARAYLRDIRRVKVGVYETRYLPPLDHVDLPMLGRFEEDGWEVAVRVREDDQMVWVLYRERHDTVRDLYVVVLDEEELVLARLQGHLDRILARAMEDHHDLLSLVDHGF